MKKKQYCLLLTGLMSLSLTGCMSFSYGNPVAEGKYDVELPNGETYEITEEEAKELQSIQQELQEDLDISDEDLEQLRKEMEKYEEKENSESETETKVETEVETESEAVTVENPYAFSYVFGDTISTSVDYLGARYDIYENGALLQSFLDEFGTLQESIEYKGVEYPVIGIRWISNREEFIIPDFIQYIYLEDNLRDSEMKNLVIPDTIKYYEVGFNQESIESIVFPKDIPTNKNWNSNFYRCYNLKTISIPQGVESLNGTFEGCSMLTEVHLPDTITEIGKWTFKDCASLSEIVIPDGVTLIGSGAFENTNISSITLPSALTSFSMDSVINCPIEELVIPDSVTTYEGDVYNLPNVKKIVFPDNLELTSLYICGCPNLELVVFPDSIQEISFDPSYLNNPSNCTFEVPEKIVEYYKNKFPEINIVAKE